MARILQQLAEEASIYIKFLIQALKGDSEENLSAIDIIFISLISLIILFIFLLVTSYIFGLFRKAVNNYPKSTWFFILVLSALIVYFIYF